MKNTKAGNSKYALKKKRGNQMYGPGCCAHDKPRNHNQEAVDKLLKAGNGNPRRRLFR